ncbi:SusC/RagA family TonB-linked outer membrane protein [Tannerella forsythia]|uniref:SusC/RagA family protein n=2 Tax=Tannerella forsythia TaxID=28112 RepID=A0A2A6E5S3_TANFO|nr:SusC/RagA family TonB-linked outer membrane protein [Tannerella forsythia]PDP42712.1 SusC/RagA family protein [Tannerella forsythia]
MRKRKSLKLMKWAMFIWLWTFPVSVFAQQITVRGNVKDVKGEPLIGVSVLISGTSLGTITDVDGNFTLNNVASDGKLHVSYVGMQSETIPVNNRTVIEVVMKEDIAALHEVVVVGYGTQERRNLTSAVTTVTSKDFLQGAANNPLQMIDGKIPGVTISNYAISDPNRNPMDNFQVRGSTSFKGGSAPLVVVDGMPGADLRQIANQDIESITVLKDGSAAAIYGSRAANGVLLITTKKGKAGKASISYDTYIEHDRVYRKPDVLSAEEFLQNKRDEDRGARTNWYDELIRKNNFGHTHHISLSGGGENAIYRISADYKDKNAIDIASARREYGVRANFNHTTLEGLLNIIGNLSYRTTKEDYTDYNAFSQAVKLNPTIPVMDPKDPGKYTFLKGYDTWNPVDRLKNRDNFGKNDYSTIDFTARLNILSNLNTELKVARQGRFLKRYEWYPSTHQESISNSRKGRARLESERWEDYTLEWITNYYTTIQDVHNIKLMGGYSYQEFNWEKYGAENMDFPSDALKYNNLGTGQWNTKEGRLGMWSEKEKEKNIAFLGRLNYDYKDVLLLMASLRYEGSSKFGKDHKWGLFPALSAAWRLSSLPIFQQTEIVDDLKLRLSYGETGRSSFPRYRSLSLYSGFGKYLDRNGQWIQVWGPGNNSNASLHWEKQISYNLGVDYALLGQRLSGSLDFFLRKGNDLIYEYDVSVPPYLHDKMYTNVISTSTRGVELMLNYNAIQTKTFNYTTNLNVSWAKTQIDSWSNDEFKGEDRDVYDLPSPGNPGRAQILGEGMEIGTFRGGRYAGVNEKGEIMIWKEGIVGGEKKLASQKNDKDRVPLGHGMPRWEMSWGHTVTYKNFDLSLFFRGKFDYKILNLYQMYYGLTAQPKVNLIRDAYTRNAEIKGEKQIVDYFLENGDYFKLDNITLGYTPKVNCKYISNLRIYATARNVFTLTKYSGIDPAGVNIVGLEPGIGNLDVYPSTTNLSFGIQISY